MAILIENARIATCTERGIVEGAILTAGARIVAIDPSLQVDGAERIDAGGRLVTPGLVDAHTHLVFGGSRMAEFRRKMAGEDYQAIAAAGGGILSTVRATRAASDDALYGLAAARAAVLREGGVTTAEVKSGYGLTMHDELRSLAIGRRLDERGVIRTRTTLLGAHKVAPEYEHDRAGYVRLVAEQMVPAAAAQGLADACDVYLDAGAFSLAEARTILEAARAHGLGVRAHVGQFEDLGGAQLVAELGGWSCDHLEQVSDRGLSAMAAGGVRAVLLPGAWRTLRQAAPDAARMVHAGVKVAVATDANPGTSPTLDLVLCAALAVRDAGLPPDQALAAITSHAADAMGASERGRLKEGGPADLAIWNTDTPDAFAYALGRMSPQLTMIGGAVVHQSDPDAPSLW